MNTPEDISDTGPGLTAEHFFESISDEDLRTLIDPSNLSTLDAIFANRVAGHDLQRVAHSLVDLGALLDNSKHRPIILQLLTDSKRTELQHRVGRDLDDPEDWTITEVTHAREFFGLIQEYLPLLSIPADTIVEPSYGLFDHQLRAVERLTALLLDGGERAILHLPTGAGKTRIAMHHVANVLRSTPDVVVVWLASGRELLEQSTDAFQTAWSHLGNRRVQLGTMWEERMPALERFTDGFLAVGLAKAWSVMMTHDPGWAARLAPRVRLVVFDEAHQAIARTYRRITEELTLDHRCALLGLTATPGRTWNDIDKDGELAHFFDGNKVGIEVPEGDPIDYLTRQGYLARPTFRTMLSDPGLTLNRDDLDRIAKALDVPDDILSELSISQQYLTAVLQSTERLISGGHRRVLVFGASVKQAQLLAAILAARKVSCSVVTASTPTKLRERAIRHFRSDIDDPLVLINYGVLTTGFDAPSASGMVIARPTKSLVLYSQMVGRAIRGPKAGGTATCEVVTVVDPTLPGFRDVADAFNNWEDVWL